MSIRYTASLSRTQNRKSFCALFQHPLRRGANGKVGLRLRKGLGTDDPAEAEMLVGQLNEILGNPALQTLEAKALAASQFDERVVAIFYSDLAPTLRDSWDIRDAALPLPAQGSAYSSLLLIGQTGSAKSTLCRQIAGTDPDREAFPSVSPNRTTICDFELIMADEDFQAVVTFMTREATRQHVEENLQAAARAILRDASDEETQRHFLIHEELRFRLQYILGNFSQPNAASDDEDDDQLPQIDPDHIEVAETEKETLASRLADFLIRLKAVTKRLASDTEAHLSLSYSEAANEKREQFEEALEESTFTDEEFQVLLDEIVDEIEKRFDFVEEGAFVRDSSEWPSQWAWSTPDRKKFIKVVNRFSSNYSQNFGRLLSPLVDGIRVAGRFKPKWLAAEASLPRLVIMDGQGLGHVLDQTGSVSTHLTKRYSRADMILLADSARQPMQQGAFELLKSVVSSGNEAKLAIAFTHFDGLKNSLNFNNREAKRAHLRSALDAVISEVGKALGRYAGEALRAGINDRVYYLANLDKPLDDRAKSTKEDLQQLILDATALKPKEEPTSLAPVYDASTLVLVLQAALTGFHERWDARLGFATHPQVRRQPWQRLKALTKRLGIFGQIEYDGLRPVADFETALKEGLRQFVDEPAAWEHARYVEKQHKLNKVAAITRQISAEINLLSLKKIFAERSLDWSLAYNHRGEGSTSARANGIRGIYNRGAPIPTTRPDPLASEFLSALKKIVRDAIEQSGGKLGVD